AGAEYDRLFNVMKLHTETTTITECSSHRLRTMMQVHHDLIDAIAGEIFGDITDQRFSEDRYRGFGAVFSEWPKACAVAGRKNDRAHRETFYRLWLWLKSRNHCWTLREVDLYLFSDCRLVGSLSRDINQLTVVA